MITIDSESVKKTWQGEGFFQGARIVLVRTMGCNFSCFWCDTKWTWKPELMKARSKQVTPQELFDATMKERRRWIHDKELDSIFGYRRWNKANIVMITGGEPTLWQNNRDFIRYLKMLKKAGMIIHFESNGATMIKPVLRKLVDVFVISPKVALYPNLYTIEKLKSYGKKVTYKIVIGDYLDLEALDKWVRNMQLDKEKTQFFISPLGTTPAEIARSLELINGKGMNYLKDMGFKNVKVRGRAQIGKGIA